MALEKCMNLLQNTCSYPLLRIETCPHYQHWYRVLARDKRSAYDLLRLGSHPFHSIDAHSRIRARTPFHLLSRSKYSLLSNVRLSLRTACRRGINAGHRIYYGRWLGSHLFYRCPFKDSCTHAFPSFFSLQFASKHLLPKS
jgi:hypothetical protein